MTVTDAAHLARIHQLTDPLGLRTSRFEYGTLIGRPARLQHDGSVTVGRRPWDVDAAGCTEGDIELREYGNGRYLGRFMLTPGPGPVPPLQAHQPLDEPEAPASAKCLIRGRCGCYRPSYG
jgi:hypothetical protein